MTSWLHSRHCPPSGATSTSSGCSPSGQPALGKDDVRVLDGDPEGDVLVGYHSGGQLVGVVALGGQAAAMGAARYRAQLLKSPALTV